MILEKYLKMAEERAAGYKKLYLDTLAEIDKRDNLLKKLHACDWFMPVEIEQEFDDFMELIEVETIWRIIMKLSYELEMENAYKFEKQIEEALKGIPVTQVRLYDDSGNQKTLVYVCIGDTFVFRYNPLLGEPTEWIGELVYYFNTGIFRIFIKDSGIDLDLDHLLSDDDFEVLEVIPGTKEIDNVKA